MRTIIPKTLAVGIIAMGCIHNFATFTPLILKSLSLLPDSSQRAFMYMSLMCGTLLVICGTLVFKLVDHIKDNSFVRAPYEILVLTLGVDGSLAVYFMAGNPFAWMIFILTTAFTIDYLCYRFCNV